ncbi:hypothetical protein OG230_12595 [Streptomyces sp. NBC_00234]|uniref:hypothetical protein n=1 Tax=Streptomyces sp. NBC_00234 TaxID=2903638 RepID=UPI002E297444|nr:hypothetical protein [Streptomyces sp. NBC_00234]
MKPAAQGRWAPLFIGAVVGGPTARNRPVSDGVGLLARLADEAPWRPTDEETGVDVVFHVPGPLIAPDYEGTRTGTLSRRDRLIAMQIAVPADLNTRGEREVVRYLADRHVEGVDLARTTVARRKATLAVDQAVPKARFVAEHVHDEG